VSSNMLHIPHLDGPFMLNMIHRCWQTDITPFKVVRGHRFRCHSNGDIHTCAVSEVQGIFGRRFAVDSGGGG